MSTNKAEGPWELVTRGITVAIAVLLAACPASQDHQSGIEGTGISDGVVAVEVSRGPIQSVDELAVKVNDVSWSLADAKTLIEGTAGSASDLNRGMIATVQGERTGPARGAATVIETEIVVRGPILELSAVDSADSVDSLSYHLNVLGQTIVVHSRTAYEVPLANLSVGDIVAVSGFVNGAGDVLAMRIAVPEGVDTAEWVVTTVVTNVNIPVRRFSMNGLEVAYTDYLLAGLPSAIETGLRLTVSGRSFTADGALIATGITPYDVSLPRTAGETVLSGVVARIDGDDISFWDRRITLSPEATITGPLAVGVYVRVTGTISADVLNAREVVVLGTGGRYDFIGQIDAVDVAARTLTMFGIEFSVGERLYAEASLDDLAVGERVGIVSYENRLVLWITRSYGRPRDVRGPDYISGDYFRDLSPPIQFTLNGVADWTVLVTGARFFYGGGIQWLDGTEISCGVNAVTAERFWQLANLPKQGRTYVSAWGRFEGNLFFAESVFLCVESPLE